MAEVKNSFLQSKMNKDLDDRLIPNGEYRDALNISVGKAEDKDVGALEAVLGNDLMVNTGNPNLVCIGQVADNQNDRIFQFWTDYTDVNNTLIPPTSGDMRITVYYAAGNSLTTLVSGTFLNFATNNQYRILGVNVLEDLLFWTDNRNQPRKINISTALTNFGYYTDEVQISVAKYAPVLPINVYLDIPVTTTSASSNPTTQSMSITVSVADAKMLHVGMQLITTLSTPDLVLNDYAVITQLDKSTGVIIVSVPDPTTTVPSGSILHFYGTSMTNEADEPNWSGDPNYLKDKYVRFSYRYKFDDGEYSLMAPFTQILFIPNQNGYFLNGDEDAAYRSTIVSWMENYINNIDLHVELPDTGNNVENSYKIKSIDILYKESNALTVQVLETVNVNEIKLQAGSTNNYTYTYRSRKPYKTLPESQTVRVYDKVPVRARAQEIVGNRVVYGNFISKSTPPASINYNLAVTKKNNLTIGWAEYPNHTLKQNRNYQAGVVLSDKFGRQSTVILSSNDIGQSSVDFNLVGSTIYSQYYSQDLNLNVKQWRGNTLAMIVNSPIVSNINEGTGTPGLYAIISGNEGQNGSGFQIIYNPSFNQLVSGKYEYIFALDVAPAQRNYPIVGNYLRGKYTDYVEVTDSSGPDGSGLYTIKTKLPINDIYQYNGVNIPPDVKYSYDLNQPGWYSYKIVVRQQQQEYYNVYLPGFLNGYPMFQTTTAPGTFPTTSANPTVFPLDEENKTAHTVLLNDNINKIPRDLAEVGPDQKQYRSSVELFGRVENLLESLKTSNKQYYPARKADVASTIASSSDLSFLPVNSVTNVYGTASNNFYQLSTTPIIARISTVNKIGVIASNAPVAVPPLAINTMNPFLSVYETAPVVSLLDIFWETSTSGLISDLNADILTGSDIAVGFDNLVFNHREFQDPNGAGSPLNFGTQTSPYITAYFQPVNSLGSPITVDSMSMTVTDGTGSTRNDDFQLIKITSGIYANKFTIKILKPFVFLKNASEKESYLFTFNIIDATNGDTVLSATSKLNNSNPVITYPSSLDPLIIVDNSPTGPIISCLGTNGAPNVLADPSFNQQQQRWSLSSVPSSISGLITIDPVTGVISLNSSFIPTDVDYNIVIRLTDAWDYTTNSAAPGSSYSERNVIVNFNDVNNACSTWVSDNTASLSIPGTRDNRITGFSNIWKLLRPGETINPIGSYINFATYSTTDNTNYSVFTPTSFYPTDFYFDYFEVKNQGSNTTPALTLLFQGIVRTNTGRIININIRTAPGFNLSPTTTNSTTCETYFTETFKSWRLVNTNPSTNISWKALSAAYPPVILGGVLSPGATIGSSFYGGTYPCIRQYSLSFGSGGVDTYSPCV
jgi:hypothetical protein